MYYECDLILYVFFDILFPGKTHRRIEKKLTTMIKILHLYLITSFLLPVILLPSKKTSNVDPECLKFCVANCSEETKILQYTWSFCASIALFLTPVVEYTFIFIQQEGSRRNDTSLIAAGIFEGVFGSTGVSCVQQEMGIAKNCEKKCNDACSHGTVHQNQTGKTLNEVISGLDKEQQIFEDLTLMTKLQYSGKLTTPHRVQIEEQASRDCLFVFN